MDGGESRHQEYLFDGKINGEKVRFYERNLLGESCLEVHKKDGSKFKFIAPNNYSNRDPFKISLVEITVGGNRGVYTPSSTHPLLAQVFKKLQEDFDWYLEKITEVNTAH